MKSFKEDVKHSLIAYGLLSFLSIALVLLDMTTNLDPTSLTIGGLAWLIFGLPFLLTIDVLMALIRRVKQKG